MDETLAMEIKKESFYHESKVGMLALLKFYSDKENFTEEELKFIDYNLHKFMNKKVMLKFFKKYQDKISLPDTFCNRTYIEYMASPESIVTIYYTIGENGESMSCPMRNVFDGIFVKDFILFYGETLRYYIVEEKNGVQQISKTKEFSMRTEEKQQNNRYDEINQILKVREEQHEEELHELLKQFAIEDYITSSLFTPL